MGNLVIVAKIRIQKSKSHKSQIESGKIAQNWNKKD